MNEDAALVPGCLMLLIVLIVLLFIGKIEFSVVACRDSINKVNLVYVDEHKFLKGFKGKESLTQCHVKRVSYLEFKQHQISLEDE